MIKKYLVIGNPIKHSLSPKLHNFWINKNNYFANKTHICHLIEILSTRTQDIHLHYVQEQILFYHIKEKIRII